MREFEYFLFENFDPDEQAQNPANPRNILSKETDWILDRIAYEDNAAKSNDELLTKLTEIGVIRTENARLSFDCPTFLREDASILNCELPVRIKPLVDQLSSSLPQIFDCCRAIQNGFSAQINLYHILCGKVFDGAFFDVLSEKNALSTSRIHASGLDYLVVIYEKCEELRTFSNRLLCSYNRFFNQYCSLQSFGDSLGSRFDFYRFFRLMEQNKLPSIYETARALIESACTNKDNLLAETAAWLHGKPCSTTTLQLLEMFGYAINGKPSVPVFSQQHQKSIAQIEGIVEQSIGKTMADILYELSHSLKITAVRHGVNHLEIANELYHLVFGYINEELIQRGIVANPPWHPSEGRFLRCIELYE